MPWSQSKFYEDPEFPENSRSVGYPGDSTIEWKRPGEFSVGAQGTGPFTLFPEDGIHPGDVCQNSIGDCWILSALSTLAMTPDWIHRAFQAPLDNDGVPCLNPNGKYVIRLFDVQQSKFVDIIIDDRIPCTEEDGVWSPIGVCITNGAIWPALLEKAVAKFFGSYATIGEGGYSDWVLTAFTGHLAACFTYNHEGSPPMWEETRTCHKLVKNNPSKLRELTDKEMNNSLSTGMLFMNVREWLSKAEHSYIIGAGSMAGSDKDDVQGVALGHAYGVLGVYPCEQGFTLVKLRNPWGEGEWQGSWSDGNELWDRYPEIAERVGYEAGDDGVFFICTEDFTQLFDQIYYVRLPRGDVPEEEDKPDTELDAWYGEDDEKEEAEQEDKEEAGDKDDEEYEDEEDDDTLAQIENVFDIFDMDASGSLSQKELTKGLKSVGFTKKQIQDALEAADEDGDGKITFEEFKQWYLDNDIQIDAE